MRLFGTQFMCQNQTGQNDFLSMDHGGCFVTVHCEVVPQRRCVQKSFRKKIVGSARISQKRSASAHQLCELCPSVSQVTDARAIQKCQECNLSGHHLCQNTQFVALGAGSKTVGRANNKFHAIVGTALMRDLLAHKEPSSVLQVICS